MTIYSCIHISCSVLCIYCIVNIKTEYCLVYLRMAAVTGCWKHEHTGTQPFFFLFYIILYGMIFSIFLVSHRPNSLWWCVVSASSCEGVKLCKNVCKIIYFALWILSLPFSLSSFSKAVHTFPLMIKTYFLRKYLCSSFFPQLLIIPLCLMCDIYHTGILYCFLECIQI